MDYPKCQRAQCSNLVTESYKRKWKGWRKYCSGSCSNLAKQENMKAALLAKHGVENAMHLDSTKQKLEATNLLKYGVKNAGATQQSIDKRNATIKEKYGVDHQMHLPATKTKIQNTCMARYGVPAISQADTVKQKKIDTCMSRYGVPNPFLNPTIIDTIREDRFKKYGVYFSGQLHIDSETIHKLNDKSWCEQYITDNGLVGLVNHLGASRPMVIKYLNGHGLLDTCKSFFEQEVRSVLQQLNTEIVQQSRKIIPPLELDFYLPEYNLAIECNGTYWHSELQGKEKNYHISKTLNCNLKNIQLLHLWEHDWIDRKDLIVSRLFAKLGQSQKLFARKTTVRAIDSDTANAFLATNHYQGACAASIRYGLYDQSTLVAVMTFGRSRYDRSVQYELLRLCYSQGLTVIGGASKLFARFVADHNPASIVSYSDRSWNSGAVYSKLGFRWSHSSPPAYHYTKDYFSLESRIKYQKHKLSGILENFDPAVSEWGNMINNGYDRVWDCGNDVWHWIKPLDNS